MLSFQGPRKVRKCLADGSSIQPTGLGMSSCYASGKDKVGDPNEPGTRMQTPGNLRGQTSSSRTGLDPIDCSASATCHEASSMRSKSLCFCRCSGRVQLFSEFSDHPAGCGSFKFICVLKKMNVHCSCWLSSLLTGAECMLTQPDSLVS